MTETDEERALRIKAMMARIKPHTNEPFMLSDWRQYSRTKSNVWAYCHYNGLVKACETRQGADEWLSTQTGGGRVFEYTDIANVEQVLRTMS